MFLHEGVRVRRDQCERGLVSDGADDAGAYGQQGKDACTYSGQNARASVREG